MKHRYTTIIPGLYVVLLLLATASTSFASSESSFSSASFSGIYLTPSLTSGVLDYKLYLGANPTITIGGNTYNVNWIQAFDVVGSTGFTASEKTGANDWTWSSKGNTAGWKGQGNDRIMRNDYKVFHFANLDFSNSNVMPGIHVGYQVCGGESTGWYKGNLQSVPELGSLLQISILLGSTAIALRRKRS